MTHRAAHAMRTPTSSLSRVAAPFFEAAMMPDVGASVPVCKPDASLAGAGKQKKCLDATKRRERIKMYLAFTDLAL